MPVVGFARISGGSPSAVRAMTNHLINQTMPADRAVLAAYYTRGLAMSEGTLAILRPDMHHSVAGALGIDPTKALTRDQIDGLLAGRRADGDFVTDKHYAKVRDLGVNPRTGEHKLATPIGSYDFCPQAPKSVSVAMATAPVDEQAIIFLAHQDAARQAVAYIAREIGVCRLGDGGKDGTVAGHVTWLEFTHLTERRTLGPDGAEVPGDPGLHTHHLFPNVVIGEDGRVGSLHTAKVRGTIETASAIYNAAKAQNLRDAGTEARLDPRTHACVLPAVPQEICDLFSKRSNGIEAAAQRQSVADGEDWSGLSKEEREARKELASRSINATEKGGKDDQADFDSWRAQSLAAGWEPPATFRTMEKQVELSDEQRIRLAYETSLPYLEEALVQNATISRNKLEAIAAYGLIEHGYKGEQDIEGVTRLMRDEGVQQDGERTRLVGLQGEDGRVELLTTELHEARETEFIALARKAADDHSAALPAELLDRKIAESGLDFTDEHGRQQLAMTRRLGEARFAVGLAEAGAGKGAALQPLVAAWKEQGRTIYGAAVASRQADALAEAGIADENVRPLSGPVTGAHARTFIEAAKAGNLDLGPNTVVVIDEVAQLGTRQALEVLRLREQHGFTLVAIGDDKQNASIEAGAVVDLTRRALSSAQVPEIETTKRQRSEREREISSLIRKGEMKLALDMKREDGTAIMVPGKRQETIAATAARYVERLKETGVAPGIAAPTNKDAQDIGIAVRAERRKLGLLGDDVMRVKAVGQPGHEFDLRLAVGDRVRLFQNNVKASFPDGSQGRIGRNGHTMDVLALDGTGLTMRSVKTGTVGTVEWKSLAAPSGRVQLAYGDALTISSAQGVTTKDFIASFPNGTSGVDAHHANNILKRHRDRCDLIVSGVFEAIEVRRSRPLDDARPVTADDQWGNVGRHLSDLRQKELALSLADRVGTIHRGSVLNFARTTVYARQAEPAGHIPERVVQHRIESIAQKVADLVPDLHNRIVVPAQEPSPDKRVALFAGTVAAGAMEHERAFEVLVGHIAGDVPGEKRLTQPPQLTGTDEDRRVQTFGWMVATRLMDHVDAVQALVDGDRERNGGKPGWDWKPVLDRVEPALDGAIRAAERAEADAWEGKVATLRVQFEAAVEVARAPKQEQAASYWQRLAEKAPAQERAPRQSRSMSQSM